MKALVPGWERACLQQALDQAGLQYTQPDASEPALSFHYGPGLDDYLKIHVSVGRGGMRFAARSLRPLRLPTCSWLDRTNELNLAWGVGRVYWDPKAREPEAASTLFACPDHVPPPEQILRVCRELWQARALLSSEEADVPCFSEPTDPTGPVWVASRFQAAGYALVPGLDGSFSRRFAMGEEGSCLIRVQMERPGVVFIDALPSLCPEWLDHPAFLWKMQALNARSRSVVIARRDPEVVLRRALPTDWIPMHADWVPLTLRELTRTCVELVQAGAHLGEEGPGATLSA